MTQSQQPPSLWTQICLTFPLHVWREERNAPVLPTKPTLHVPSSSRSSWCSTNPTALTYQLLLTLRGIDFDLVQQPSQDWWGPSVPFLVVGQQVVRVEDLDAWIAQRQPQEKAPADEAKLYTTLLDTHLRDAVTLTQLLSQDPIPHNCSFFSRLLATTPTPHLTQTGKWTENVPGWLDAVTLLGLNGDQDEKTSASTVQQFNPDDVIREGVDAVHAVASRMGERDEKEWFLGSNHATKLDAQLFALLHTILSQDEGVLREAVLSQQHLVDWTMRVYQTYVKEREVDWRSASGSVE